MDRVASVGAGREELPSSCALITDEEKSDVEGTAKYVLFLQLKNPKTKLQKKTAQKKIRIITILINFPIRFLVLDYNTQIL